MAGGAGTYLIDGIAYSLVSTASAALIIDEDGAATTAIQNLIMSIDVANDKWTLPTTAQVDAGKEFPVVLKSANAGAPQTWSHNADHLMTNAGADCYVKVEDLTLSISLTNKHIYNIALNQASRNIEFNNINASCTGLGSFVRGRYYKPFSVNGGSFVGSQYRVKSSTSGGQISIINTKVELTNTFSRLSAWRDSSIHIQGSRFYINNASNYPFFDSNLYLPFVSMLHNMIYFNTSGYLFSCQGTQTLFNWPRCRMNIIHNAKGFMLAGNAARQDNPLSVIGDNIWSSLDASGNDFVATSDPVDTLANWQTAGQEDGSTQETITAASITLADADFLDPNATLATKRHAGVNEDRDGTAMRKWSGITPGAKQQAAATEPTANDIIKSAGGNWDDDNLTDQADFTANVKNGVAGGLSWTGGYDNSSPPDDVIKSAGGNWDDDNILNQADATANVRIAKAVGLGWTGGLLPGGGAPTIPTVVITDRGDGTGADAVITGADAGTTNSLYTMDSAGVITSQGNITGNGSIAIDTAIGVYWGYLTSVGAGGTSLVLPQRFFVTDGATAFVRSDFGDLFDPAEESTLLDQFGEEVIYSRGEDSVSLVGYQVKMKSEYDPATGMLVKGESFWFVKTEDLDFGAGPIEPKLHDQIATSAGVVQDVTGPGSIDSERIMRHIPTVRVDYTA